MIKVTYRRTSRMTMRIGKNGDVLVSVPIGVPKADVKQFIDKNKSWIQEARQKNYERQKARYDFYNQLPVRTEQQIHDALERINRLIDPMVERNVKRMGLETPLFFFRPYISRWGQCNVKDKTICFSIYLLLLPEWCVEHVVVHELCHLFEPSHNARFHALMDKYFPRWREARAETRRISNMADDQDGDDKEGQD